MVLLTRWRKAQLLTTLKIKTSFILFAFQRLLIRLWEKTNNQYANKSIPENFRYHSFLKQEIKVLSLSEFYHVQEHILRNSVIMKLLRQKQSITILKRSFHGSLKIRSSYSMTHLSDNWKKLNQCGPKSWKGQLLHCGHLSVLLKWWQLEASSLPHRCQQQGQIPQLPIKLFFLLECILNLIMEINNNKKPGLYILCFSSLGSHMVSTATL